MKYYLISGEASGDLHGSNLIKSIKNIQPNAQFRFWGGDMMQQASGVPPVKHYKELAFMGFWEVIKNLNTIFKNISLCKADIQNFQPDVLILIDYPGFNFRLLKFAKHLGIKVVYYISPQLWAWKESRVEQIRHYVDEMLVILPFEKDFYKKHHVEVNFVGHPLLDAISEPTMEEKNQFLQENNLEKNRPIIALLPGSRKQEIEKMLGLMLSIKTDFPNYQFVIAGAPGISPNFYASFKDESVSFVCNQTYALLSCAHAALVTSGTATLETALFRVPEVVCYRSSWLSYEIGKRLVKNIKYISLVNLIMDGEVVKELIQNELNTPNLKKELLAILEGEARSVMLKDFESLREKLGGSGASKKAAEAIIKILG